MIKKIQKKLTKTFKLGLRQSLLLILLSLFLTDANAQSKERKMNVGFFGGISVYAGDLGNSMTDFTSDVFTQNLIGGLRLSRYLNKSFDISLMGTIGSWGYYKNDVTIFKGDMLHGNLHLRYKFNNGYFLAEDAWIAPYIFGGMGITKFDGDRISDVNDLDYPIVGGLGFRLRLTDVTSINYQATFGYMSTARNNPNVVPYHYVEKKVMKAAARQKNSRKHKYPNTGVSC